MKLLDYWPAAATAMFLILVWVVAIAYEDTQAAFCAARGGVRVYTTCLKKDAVLP
jgi:hypothetical protein